MNVRNSELQFNIDNSSRVFMQVTMMLYEFIYCGKLCLLHPGPAVFEVYLCLLS